MKRLLLIFFILFLVVPVFSKQSKLKLSFDNKPKTVFKVLQYTSLLSMNIDTTCTYNSYWNYGRGELNPILRKLLPHPELVFVYRLVVNVGVILITNTLHKKNKILAYSFLIAINVIAIYFVSDHIKDWRRGR